ncbi:DUF6797 domain-containing protein [Alienimonas chondri]|uniref:Cytochrome c domain-containing protein n=1 Tax=Alienimonas chondri TaxID=2681879 RepID=A0ABX1V7C8_9PLAN|nr:DUF6797 domain-containing protein [Alienimonas chondri]NNJ24130.1 hypothetical protein [Alienimonas chondri]
MPHPPLTASRRPLRSKPFAASVFALTLASVFSSPALAASLQQQLENADPALVAREARLRGDAHRGALVYYTSAAACVNCHESDEGRSPLGPDLTKLGEDATDVHLVESLLRPSKAIREGYHTVQILTADGQLRAGMFVRENDDAIVLREAEFLENEVSIPKRNILERGEADTSMMPAGLVSTLKSQREFLDLLSYLFAVRDGGPARAEELKPPAEALVVKDDTANLDHAGILRAVEKSNHQRGETIYQSACIECHGPDGNTPSLATARAFGTQKLKYGSDPYGMFQTLSHGNGLMRATTALSPRERYEVIGYIRDRFMKGSNPDYRPLTDDYLKTLPIGTENGEIDLPPDRDYGPALASQLGREVNSALTIQLDGLTISYDLHSMDQADAWSGGFLNLDGTQHKRGRGEGYPQPQGEEVEALNLWNWGHGGTLDYSTDDLLPRGPMPRRWMDYHGHYLSGDRVVLSYAIDGREILEVPSAIEGRTAVRHTLKIGAGGPLILAAGDAGSGAVRPRLFGDQDGVVVAMDEKQRWVVRIPADDQPRLIDVVRLTKPADSDAITSLPPIDPAAMTAGGPAQWAETFETVGYRGFETGAYAVDTITLPESTPWNTWFRTSALDFFPDGRMVVTTVGGDVWIVSGVDDQLLNLTWKRFAGGLYEPFGVKVVDGLIYVTCRDRLTRLHDLNEDGEADFYESFSADDDVSTFYHAFNFDLQTDPEGNFYYAKSGQYTDYKFPGSVVKIGPEGGEQEVVCTGFRTPNGMGAFPDGRLTVSDNQGSWMPASKISLIEPGGFYGYVQTHASGRWAPDGGAIDHKTVVPPDGFDQPIIWMPQEVDNSSGGQVYVDDARFGPLSGHLLHTSFGKGWLYSLMTQEIDGVMQAALVKLPHDFVTGVMRARVNPADGQVYTTGVNGWNAGGRAGLADGGIERLRYTGKPARMITDCRVGPGTLHITFSFPLAPDAAADVAAYTAEQWNYKWTAGYGSNFYHPDTGEVGKQTVTIAGATLSEDGRSVTLKVPDLQPVEQLHLTLNVADRDGEAFSEEVYWTIHALPED